MDMLAVMCIIWYCIQYLQSRTIYIGTAAIKKKPTKKNPLLPPLKTMLEFTTKMNWLKSSTLFIGGEGRGACCARKNVKFIEIDDRSNYFVRDCL